MKGPHVSAHESMPPCFTLKFMWAVTKHHFPHMCSNRHHFITVCAWSNHVVIQDPYLVNFHSFHYFFVSYFSI